MLLAGKKLRQSLAAAACGLALAAIPAGAQEEIGDRTFNPWGDTTEEQIRTANSPCTTCDTRWCDTNFGDGYDGSPLPGWTDLPPWYVGADALFLTRDSSEDITFATRGQQGPEVLTTEDIDYELQPGVRVFLGRTINDYFRVEAMYFGQHQWRDRVTVRNSDPNALGGLGNLFSPFSGFGNPNAIAGLDFNNLVSISSASELDSAEVNVLHRSPTRCGAWELTFLCGMRYVRVDEAFQYLAVAGVPTPLGATNQVDVVTSNDLIGGQIGGSVIYRVSERWWINTDAKLGVLGNAAEQDTIYAATNNQGATTVITANAHEGATAFLGELRVESCYQLLPRLTVIGGYQAMWVDGLALGTNNLQRDFNLLTLGPAQLDHNGTTVYHGPHAGIVWTW